MQAEALVCARPEGEVPVGAARGVEAARILEMRRVVIGGDIVHHQPVVLGDGLAAHLGILGGSAHEMLDRRGPADRLFDDTRQQAAIGAYAGPLLRIARQGEHGASRTGTGRIVPRGGQDDVIAHHVAVVQRLAVDHRISDGAGNIRGRAGPAFRRELGEIGFEVLDRACHQLRDRLGRQVLHAGLVEILVGPAEHLLGQHQHARFVFLRHAEDLHHHMQRIGRGHRLDEVGFPAACQQAFDRRARDGANLVFDRAQVLGHEPFLRQLAVFHVDRRIEGHQAGNHMLAPAAERLGEFDALGQAEDHGMRIVEEGGIVLRHAHDVVIARDQPERRVDAAVFWLDPGDRRFGAQAVEGIEQSVPLGIAGRVDDLAGGSRVQPGLFLRRHQACSVSISALARYSSRSSRL